MKQVSAIERLRSLPALFMGSDLTVRFQWTRKTASQYIYLWKKRGLVQPLGGHSDVFANLLVEASPNWQAALLLAMPSGVLVGIESLHRAGWTTQIPSMPVVAVDASQRVFTTDMFEIEPRDDLWFERTKQGIKKGVYRESLSVLSPAWALADMLRVRGWGSCGLQPDDIEWDAVTAKDERDWTQACKTLGIATGDLLSLAQSSRSHA